RLCQTLSRTRQSLATISTASSGKTGSHASETQQVLLPEIQQVLLPLNLSLPPLPLDLFRFARFLPVQFDQVAERSVGLPQITESTNTADDRFEEVALLLFQILDPLLDRSCGYHA